MSSSCKQIARSPVRINQVEVIQGKKRLFRSTGASAEANCLGPVTSFLRKPWPFAGHFSGRFRQSQSLLWIVVSLNKLSKCSVKTVGSIFGFSADCTVCGLRWSQSTQCREMLKSLQSLPDCQPLVCVFSHSKVSKCSKFRGVFLVCQCVDIVWLPGLQADQFASRFI